MVVHDPWTGGYTSIMRVRAPAFLLLDPETQDAQVSGWGRVQAGLCQSNLISRAQVLELCVPDSGDGLRDYYAQHAHGQDLSEWATENYRDLMDVAGPASSRSEALFALTLDSRRCKSLVQEVRRRAPRRGEGPRRAAAGGRGRVGGVLPARRGVAHRSGSRLRAALRLRPGDPPGPGLPTRPPAGTWPPRGRWRCRNTGTTCGPTPSFHSRVVADRVAPQPGVSDVPGPAGADPGDRPAADPAVRADPDGEGDEAGPAGQDRADLQRARQAEARAGREPGRRRRTHRHPAAGGRDQRRPRRHGLRRPARRQSGPTLDELTLAVGAIRQAAIQANCEARVLAGQQMQAFAAAALPLTRGF